MKRKVTTKDFLRLALHVNLIAVFFFSFGLAGRHPYNYVNIVLWLSLGVFYFALRRVQHIKPFKFRFDIFMVAMAVYCLAILLSFALSGFIAFSKSGIACALSGLIVYWMLSDEIVSKKEMLICACIGACGLLVLFGVIYRNDIFHPNFSKRIGDFFDNQNEIALNLALCMILLFGLGMETKEWYLKISGIAFSLIAFYFVLLTGSVSAVLTITIVFAIAIPFFFKKIRWIVITVEAAIILGGIIAIFTLPIFSYYAERLSRMLSSLGLGTGRGDSSSETRFASIVVGLRIFLDNPLFGAGNDSVVRAFDIMAHNNFAEVLADYGVFAFLAHEATMLIPLHNLRKRNQQYKLVALTLLLFMLLFQFFLFTFNSKSGILMIAISFYIANPDGCYTNDMKRSSIRYTKIDI